MEQEVIAILGKVPKEFVPPPGGESEFYSWYFITPTKNGGVTYNSRSVSAESHVENIQVQDVNLKKGIVTQIRSNWFVMIHPKDAYFHISPLS